MNQSVPTDYKLKGFQLYALCGVLRMLKADIHKNWLLKPLPCFPIFLPTRQKPKPRSRWRVGLFQPHEDNGSWRRATFRAGFIIDGT
jgi:hypothetical protein